MSLPLMGFCNPKTIWDYTCYAIDLVKRFFSDVEKGKHPTITVTGNNNTVIYNVDQSTHEYPKETVDIANTSIPFYQKISAELNRGHFTSFTASTSDLSIPPIRFDTNSESLFKEKTIIDETPIKISCNIISFNKESLTGRLRILNESSSLTTTELPFCVIGNQDESQYIKAMALNSVQAKVLKETAYTSLKPRIKRLQIISLENTP